MPARKPPRSLLQPPQAPGPAPPLPAQPAEIARKRKYSLKPDYRRQGARLAAASPCEGYAANSIPRRNDPRILHHQDSRPLRRAGAVHNPSRHNEALPRRKLDDAVFEVDQELALHHVKELVVFIVLVPVVFAFD